MADSLPTQWEGLLLFYPMAKHESNLKYEFQKKNNKNIIVLDVSGEFKPHFFLGGGGVNPFS